MQLEDFDYDLPPELVAQQPSPRRDASRLMTVDRRTGMLGELPFAGIVGLLRAGDILVVNDTRVIPARLLGTKDSGGRIEVFLVRRCPGDGEDWHCLVKASKPPRPGSLITLQGGMNGIVTGRSEDLWVISFSPAEGFSDWLDSWGEVPLPPYIRRNGANDDRERYQTVFARERGAVAAPTAGLHMTPELLRSIRDQGVEVHAVTLHVGLGTFLPVRVDRLQDHRMHRESYVIPDATAAAIRRTRESGGRVIALGTTTTRALEHDAAVHGAVQAGSGEADIFIYPGFRFNVVDALITNFHLPKSTLLMLVSAFAGRELVFRAYEEAIRRQFRFFSYGDAMFIF